MNFSRFCLPLAAACFSLVLAHAADPLKTEDAPVMQAGGGKALYVANRAPLAPSPFVKLPIGSITPKGWLRHQLELERDGMAGHLEEISPWLDFTASAWANKDGEGKNEWEELPYWLKGYGDLGYVLKDEKVIAEARKWLEAIMTTQRTDGYFGPRKLLTATEGKPDLWPQMCILNALQSYYEFSGDQRALDMMARYFRWQNNLPADGFSIGYWARVRMGDNLESIYWLYNRTGDASLLELAKKIFDSSARWDKDVINWHNVNIAQGFRTPTIFWMQDQRPELFAGAERNYSKVMGIYGQMPGGGFAADENARQGYYDPRQGFETCGMVEFMHSFELLTKITGQPVWADRCEEIAFNSFPAAMTADLKSLHYLTSANSVQLDHGNKAPGLANSGEMVSFSPYEAYRCCQHNHTMGWPYYAEELWLATPDQGLCASLYAASEVKAKVGPSGQEVTIAEETDYPFDETVTLKIADAPSGANFPLYLRIPHWCQGATVAINGQPAPSSDAKANSYLKIDARAWKTGDVVTLKLPMQLALRRWAKNKDSVSVDRGPLTFSLAITARTETYGKHNAQWPETDVFAASPWNYGLALDDGKSLADQFEVIKKPGHIAPQPFTLDDTPIELRAKARKIPEWGQDKHGLLTTLQPSPAKTAEPVETVRLVPMGAARLRITAFPTVSDGSAAHAWTAPASALYKATASHMHESDSLDALSDRVEPTKSGDESIPRFTWWDHRGTTEWVQYDFSKARKISSASVYWFDDTGSGSCRVPQTWKLLYKDASGEWKPVSAGANSYGTKRDGYNVTTFAPVETTALRLEAQLQLQYSGGILEWKIE